MLIEIAVWVVEVKCRIKDDVFLNHFFFNDLLARHRYALLPDGVGSSGDADFKFWVDFTQHFLRLLGILAAELVLLVDDDNDRHTAFLLSYSCNIIERF